MDLGRSWTADYEQGSGTATQVSANAWRIDLENDPGQVWTLDCDVTLSGVAGLTLSFQIRYKRGAYSPFHEVEPTTWRPVWSDDDGATWHRVAAVSWNSTTKVISFTLPRAVGASGAVRLTTMGDPYTLHQFSVDMARWLASGYVTRSAVGTSVQGRPIYRFTVNDARQAGRKTKIAQYRSGHETERPATWRVRHMVDWACGASAEAVAFRARNILHSVVIANPDCLVNGWQRVNADGIENNRWATSNGASDGTPAAPTLDQEGAEQFAVHSDLEANLSDLDLFVDHHCANHVGEYIAYAPGDSALAALDLATFDPANLIDTVVADTGVGATNKFSHRNVASRLGCLSAIVDGGAVTHASGTVVTPTTQRSVAIALLRACDDFLH